MILGEKARTLVSAEDRKYVCTLKLPGRDETFKEFGYSEYDARFGAARTAYRFLEDNSLFPTIKDEMRIPTTMILSDSWKHYLEEAISLYLLISIRKHMMRMVIRSGLVSAK